MRHNIDVMHVEKNVCESVVNTLLNIVGKTKDTEKACFDLADMKIRNEFMTPQKPGVIFFFFNEHRP